MEGYPLRDEFGCWIERQDVIQVPVIDGIREIPPDPVKIREVQDHADGIRVALDGDAHAICMPVEASTFVSDWQSLDCVGCGESKVSTDAEGHALVRSSSVQTAKECSP